MTNSVSGNQNVAQNKLRWSQTFNFATNPSTSDIMSSSVFQNYNMPTMVSVMDMNRDIMTPAWMQNIGYGQATQYDFSGLMQNPWAMPGQSYVGYQPQNPAYPPQGNYTLPVMPSQNPAVPNAPVQNVPAPTQQYQNPFAPQPVVPAYSELNNYGISTSGNAKKDEQALKAAKAKETKTLNEAAKIAEDLYDAMKGAGTKNDKLKAAVARINKDNVLQVLEAWNTQYASDMDGETLIQSIQAEHYTGWFGHQQEDLENHLKDVLFAKAKELGLQNEAHAFRAKVNYEHESWFTSDESVSNSFNSIIEQVATADAKQRTERAQKAAQNNK